MVSRKTRKRKALRFGIWRKRRLIMSILGGLLVVVICGVILHAKVDNTFDVDFESTDEVAEQSAEENSENEEQIQTISFQGVIDDWVSSTNGNKSVVIYDLDNHEIVGEYNSDEVYNTASLYKLFVVYEGYRRVESGEWDGRDKAGATGETILKCLDLSIRESNSVCAETLLKMISVDEMDKIVKDDYGASDTVVSQLISTPMDIMRMMKKFYRHTDISSPELISLMKDSFLNQPKTEYDWRQGLPSGFARANVYNKVGWDYNGDDGYWNVYHDASIVNFPEDDRHFVIVVMTEHVPFQKITNLGAQIEKYYYNQ